MRIRSHRSMLLAGAIAAWYCAAALTQTTGGAQGTPTPSSQPNPSTTSTPSQPNATPASTPNPTPASTPNPTPASTPNPTPANRATPTPASPPAQQQPNDQSQFPASSQRNDGARGTSQPQASRCAALTGVSRSECERRDTTNTENLPAGVTQGQMDRQAQRAAEAARDTQTRSSSADTMRAPPTSAPATSTTTPQPTAPSPTSTPREDADTLNPRP